MVDFGLKLHPLVVLCAGHDSAEPTGCVGHNKIWKVAVGDSREDGRTDSSWMVDMAPCAARADSHDKKVLIAMIRLL
jgi:hypothetical protein